MNAAFLWARAKPYLPELALIGGLALVGSLATLAVPWLAGNFLAGIIGESPINLETTLWLLVIALFGLTALNVVVAILSEVAAGRILAGLRRETYDRLQAMPIAFHDDNRSGELLALMTYEVDNLSGFLTSTLATLPSMLITATGAVILLFLLDPTMAMVVPIMVPAFYLTMKLLGRRMRMLAQRVREAEIRLMWMGERDLEMLTAIKSFAVESEHRHHYHAAIETSRSLSLSQTRSVAFIGPMVSLVAGLAAIAILLIGSERIADGTRSPGELFSFLLYAALLTRPVGRLADTYGAFQRARGTMAQLAAVFAKPLEPGYAASGKVGRAQGAIAFEQVSFGYPSRGAVLEGFNLAIAPGEIVALTGANGIGKSTLIRLLLRFYDPHSGRITLDGTDITQLQVQDLRRQFGYVPQRALLFHGTIRDNIAFGIDDPDPGAIEHAVRLSQAWEFIQHLPDGLATQIGDNGIRLSGGQRQRIALARALFRDPPIYIFDEATSMYDLEGEAAFVEACIEGMKGRTVIIITHRPASLALADRVIRIDQGGAVTAISPAEP